MTFPCWHTVCLLKIMTSRASIGGHPLHPIFVTIPVGLWSFSPFCDLIYHLGWGSVSWKAAALYCLAGGLVGAVPAIITGLIDFTGITDPVTRRVAIFHLAMNFLTLPFITVSIGLRWNEAAPTFSLLPVVISFVGVLLVSLSGWLGGELVSTYGVGVHGAGKASPDNFRKAHD